MFARAAVMLAALAPLALTACAVVEQHKPADPSLPTAAAFAAAHNARVAGLSRLWSRTTVRIAGTDADGQRVDEQVDGRLFVELPANLHMRISKLGEPYFLLGSNAAQFWWFDLSKDDRPASIGSHANATRAQVQRFGLPVHPLDLVELLAVSPITPQALADPAAVTRRVSEREAELDLPARWGRLRLRFNTDSLLPVAVTLVDEKGRTAVRSELQEFDPLPVLVGDGNGPKIEHRAILHLAPDPDAPPGPKLVITLDLEFEAKRINPDLFDLDVQKAQQNVRTIRSLDPAPPAGGKAP